MGTKMMMGTTSDSVRRDRWHCNCWFRFLLLSQLDVFDVENQRFQRVDEQIVRGFASCSGWSWWWWWRWWRGWRWRRWRRRFSSCWRWWRRTCLCSNRIGRAWCILSFQDDDVVSFNRQSSRFFTIFCWCLTQHGVRSIISIIIWIDIIVFEALCSFLWQRKLRFSLIIIFAERLQLMRHEHDGSHFRYVLNKGWLTSISYNITGTNWHCQTIRLTVAETM